MNFKEALEILNVENNNTDDPPALLKTVKHQYHKLALLFHPDKNNTPHATEQFRKINEAYEYIKSHTSPELENNSVDDTPQMPPPFSPKEYKQYIYHFLTTIYEKSPKGQQQTFANLLSNLADSCEKTVIPILQKYRSNQVLLFNVYQVIVKYKDIFNVSLDVLTKIEEFIKTNLDVPATEDETHPVNVVLKPRFKDLMEGNVFYSRRYNIYIPLWALNTELCYDVGDGRNDDRLQEIVFSCMFDTSAILTSKSPEIQSIRLDETANDVCLSVLFNVEDLINHEVVFLEIDGVNVPLDVDRIKIKKNQVITLVGCGIPIYNPDDVFNIEIRGNIIIMLELVV